MAKTKGKKTQYKYLNDIKVSVATMIGTHSKVDIVILEVDNQMVVIQIQVGKNTIEDVMLDGANVNIITKNLKTKLGLPKPRPTHITSKQN